MKKFVVLEAVVFAIGLAATPGCRVEEERHERREERREERHEEHREHREQRTCPRCGVAIDVDARACFKCGISLR